MSFNGIDSKAFKIYIEELTKVNMATGCRCSNCSKPDSSPKKSEEDTCGGNGKCDPCSCSKKCNKKTKCACKNKSNKDGSFCRKCNNFQPMVEPDDDDGKCLCYGCKYPWGK